MSNLSMGILPGLEVADKLRNSRAATESQEVQDMIKLGEFQNEQADRQLDQDVTKDLISIASGQGRAEGGSLAQDDDDPASLLERLGERYIAGGAPKRGKEMLSAAIDYRKKKSDIEKGGV